jgi:hypothetical protein
MSVNDDGVIQSPGGDRTWVHWPLGKNPGQDGLSYAKQEQCTGYRAYFQSSKRHSYRNLQLSGCAEGFVKPYLARIGLGAGTPGCIQFIAMAAIPPENECIESARKV